MISGTRMHMGLRLYTASFYRLVVYRLGLSCILRYHRAGLFSAYKVLLYTASASLEDTSGGLPMSLGGGPGSLCIFSLDSILHSPVGPLCLYLSIPAL